MAQQTETSVYIVDDDKELAGSLKTMFSALGFDAHCFFVGEELMQAVQSQKPDCLLLDIHLPDIDGLSLLERLIDMHAGLPVVMMTGYSDVPLAVRAMKAGARDFIEKPFESGVAIAAVRNGLASIANEKDHDASSLLKQLTPREHQVFEGIMQGLFNKEIADKLGISRRTVEFHRANVMEKTGTRNVSELLRLSIRSK